MGGNHKGRPINGWLLIDKPSGPTSTRVVSRVRHLLEARKIGHGGTLDPLATGLLPIALGEATKTVSCVMDGRKTYRFTLRWGQATRTDDAEGEVVAVCARRPTAEEMRAALPGFLGTIEQVPPVFSAIKVAGRRAYDRARAEESFDLAPRRVEVLAFDLIGCPNSDHASFEVSCGKGTYMRALGRDLGRALGTCAHIVALRRTAVGPFGLSRAISLETLESLGHSAAASGALLPIETALDDIPALALSETEANRLRCGQAVSMLARTHRESIRGVDNGAIVFATTGGRPVALARYEAGDIHPVRILNL